MLYYDAFVPTKKRVALRVHDRRYDYKKSLFPSWLSDIGYILLIALCWFLSFCGFAFSIYCLSKVGG